MSKRKNESSKRIRKRPVQTKHTETFEDCTVTVQGNKVWISGPLADEIAEVARRAGRTFQDVFKECVRTGVPLLLTEHRANRRERNQRKKV